MFPPLNSGAFLCLCYQQVQNRKMDYWGLLGRLRPFVCLAVSPRKTVRSQQVSSSMAIWSVYFFKSISVQSCYILGPIPGSFFLRSWNGANSHCCLESFCSFRGLAVSQLSLSLIHIDNPLALYTLPPRSPCPSCLLTVPYVQYEGCHGSCTRGCCSCSLDINL